MQAAAAAMLHQSSALELHLQTVATAVLRPCWHTSAATAQLSARVQLQARLAGCLLLVAMVVPDKTPADQVHSG